MIQRITYFINQYPKVSHSFIRREILALERLGFDVQRIALRGWNDAVADPEDVAEKALTRYVLQGGVMSLVLPVLNAMVATPVRFINAVGLAVSMSRHADRPLPYHLIYLAEACRILPWLRSHQSRHVHAHFGTNSTEVVMLANALGGPGYSFTVHGPEEFDKPQFIHLGEKIRRSKFVVAISSYGRSQLYRWVEYAQWFKVQVVHCGLEAAFHSVAPTSSPDVPRLVCVGRLCEQKGQLLLVQALATLLQRGVACELVLAGDGEMREELEALIAANNLGKYVRITGWISSGQVRDELLAARALVLPSFAEGLPVVVMEAMALQRPVLTTAIAGIPELVRDGESGWLFTAGSAEELTNAMERCLAAPSEIMSAMGAQARMRVLQRHSVDVEAGKLAQHFMQAMSEWP
jgi:colanic acid/amylovoran biosynthesis glycosyltransferase